MRVLQAPLVELHFRGVRDRAGGALNRRRLHPHRVHRRTRGHFKEIAGFVDFLRLIADRRVSRARGRYRLLRAHHLHRLHGHGALREALGAFGQAIRPVGLRHADLGQPALDVPLLRR